MVIFNNQVPALLIPKRGVNDKIAPIEKSHRVQKHNSDQRRPDEQKKNDVKTTAAILRIFEQTENSPGINRIYKTTKRNRTIKKLQEI